MESMTYLYLCTKAPSRSDTYSSSAEGVAIDWKTMLTYISGSVDEELLLPNEYLVVENRVLRNQIQGRLRLTDAKRPGRAGLESVCIFGHDSMSSGSTGK